MTQFNTLKQISIFSFRTCVWCLLYLCLSPGVQPSGAYASALIRMVLTRHLHKNGVYAPALIRVLLTRQSSSECCLRVSSCENCDYASALIRMGSSSTFQPFHSLHNPSPFPSVLAFHSHPFSVSPLPSPFTPLPGPCSSSSLPTLPTSCFLSPPSHCPLLFIVHPTNLLV